MNDEQLIDEALAGDSAAFGRLVLKYQDRLYHAMTQILGSAADAEDVVQESFVQAFLKLETFRRSALFYTWLYRIAANAACTLARRRRPARSVEQMREAAVEPADRGESPSGRLERAERAAQLKAALARLPQDYREALVLREIEGFDYGTIAGLLDLPIGTVRSRLFRARMQLREYLKELDPAEPPKGLTAAPTSPTNP
ncbi:MAG TPA: sigma-70 family RNA polymerase sigma factor [Pirellulales bacterium]|nr:sigma-70 family RNA polymerase sigma factor [Pirellulales bacterium]